MAELYHGDITPNIDRVFESGGNDPAKIKSRIHLVVGAIQIYRANGTSVNETTESVVYLQAEIDKHGIEASAYEMVQECGKDRVAIVEGNVASQSQRAERLEAKLSRGEQFGGLL